MPFNAYYLSSAVICTLGDYVNLTLLCFDECECHV